MPAPSQPLHHSIPPLRASSTSVTAALSPEAAPAAHSALGMGFGAAARGRTMRVPISSRVPILPQALFHASGWDGE